MGPRVLGPATSGRTRVPRQARHGPSLVCDGGDGPGGRGPFLACTGLGARHWAGPGQPDPDVCASALQLGAWEGRPGFDGNLSPGGLALCASGGRSVSHTGSAAWARDIWLQRATETRRLVPSTLSAVCCLDRVRTLSGGGDKVVTTQRAPGSPRGAGRRGQRRRPRGPGAGRAPEALSGKRGGAGGGRDARCA